jgi:chromate transport protein ChrA
MKNLFMDDLNGSFDLGVKAVRAIHVSPEVRRIGKGALIGAFAGFVLPSAFVLLAVVLLPLTAFENLTLMIQIASGIVSLVVISSILFLLYGERKFNRQFPVITITDKERGI